MERLVRILLIVGFIALCAILLGLALIGVYTLAIWIR